MMNAHATIEAMTPDAIRSRILHLQSAERGHTARDLDAELSKVILAGGDVETKEAEILEAERVARRNRAERMALEKELPGAVQRQGDADLSSIVQRHDEAAQEASEAVGVVVQALDGFRSSVRALMKLQDEAYALTERAGAIARETGADMPALGPFHSPRMIAIAVEFFGIPRDGDDLWFASLRNPERYADVGNRLHRRDID